MPSLERLGFYCKLTRDIDVLVKHLFELNLIEFAYSLALRREVQTSDRIVKCRFICEEFEVVLRLNCLSNCS